MLQAYLLELDGKLAGRLIDSQGGGMEADVVTSSVGGGQFQRKHLTQVKYGDIVLTCGPGMSRGFYDWVGSSFARGPLRTTGAVITLDRNSKPINRLEFRDALVKSLVLPELHKPQGDLASLVITIKPGTISLRDADQKQNLGVYAAPVAKRWRTSDFRLKISGLETACAQVTRIKSLNLGETLVEDPIGKARSTDVVAVKTTFSDVELELPLVQARPFYEWFKDFVINGNNMSGNEKQGSLDLLAPGSSSPYFTVKLDGLGISKFSQDNATSKITMYCEDMAFSAGQPAIL